MTNNEQELNAPIPGAAEASSEAGVSTGQQQTQMPAAPKERRTRSRSGSGTGNAASKRGPTTRKPGTSGKTRNRGSASSQQGVSTGSMPITAFGPISTLFGSLWRQNLSVQQNRMAINKQLAGMLSNYTGPGTTI